MCSQIFAPWIKNFRNIFLPFDHHYLFAAFLLFHSFICKYSVFQKQGYVFMWNTIKGIVSKRIAFLNWTFTSARHSYNASCMSTDPCICRIYAKQPLHQNGSLNDFTFWRSYQGIDPLLFIRHCKSKKVVIKMMLFIFSLICTYVLVSTSVASHFFK